jgi:O-methyltransferase involved in polyketide biosynthesis
MGDLEAVITEDRLEEVTRQGVCQYIILRVVLDTFAYRRPDLSDHLPVFELGHPATQAIKRERVTAAGWKHPSNLHFVPVDFTMENLADAFERARYDPTQ